MKIQDPAVRAQAMRIAASTTPPSGEETVTVTVDGRTVEVPAGASILEAARLAGRLIPTLCHHPDLPDAGVCRVCVVEVSGQRNLQASCAFPITAPVDIQTYSPRVRQARRDIVDLMLAEHCGDCQTCGRNGNCELQDLAAEYGSDIFRFGRAAEPEDVGAVLRGEVLQLAVPVAAAGLAVAAVLGQHQVDDVPARLAHAGAVRLDVHCL